MSAKKMIICPVCSRLLLPDDIPAHHRICRGGHLLTARPVEPDTPKRPPSKERVPLNSSSSPQSNQMEELGDILTELQNDDTRDASRGWGHHFHDNGSYGSYPVHDNFDDESKP